MCEIKQLTPEEKHESWLASGKWAAMTLGELVSIMIDGGNTDTAFVRVIKQGEPDIQGLFTMQLELHLVPNGYVMDHAAAIGCDLFHGRMIQVISKGLVK